MFPEPSVSQNIDYKHHTSDGPGKGQPVWRKGMITEKERIKSSWKEGRLEEKKKKFYKEL